MKLAEIKRSVRPGQLYRVTNHREETLLGPVLARVDRLSGGYGFYLRGALGQLKVNWPPSRHITLEADGTLHLRGTGELAGLPFLTLVPADDTAARTQGQS